MATAINKVIEDLNKESIKIQWSDWERRFMNNVSGFKDLSGKQEMVIRDMYKKYCRKV